MVPVWMTLRPQDLTWKFTTVVMAQNDTSKTPNITFSILHVERYTRPYQRSHEKMKSKILYGKITEIGNFWYKFAQKGYPFKRFA